MSDISQLEKRRQAISAAGKEQALRNYANDQRDRAASAAVALLGEHDLTDATRARVDELLSDADRWAARAADYAERASRRSEMARVVREPLTYDRRAPHSWFADLVADQHANNRAALARLEKHEREMRVELAARTVPERRNRGDVMPADVSFERRAGGVPEAASHFTPPLWLLDLAGLAVRPERVLADLVPSFPLQRGVSSVNIPRLTAGTATGLTTPRGPVASRAFTDAPASSPVVPIAGFSDFPEAMVEQLPMGAAALDLVLWRDLLNDYDARLEAQLVAGTGFGGQLTGLANVEGAESVSYISGSPTAIGAYKALGEAFGAVSDARRIRPECWLLRGGRWAFFTTGPDLEGRPLGVPAAANPAPVTPDGVPDPVGALLGLPVFTAEAMSSTLGGATPESGTQDQIIAARPSDYLLWESIPTVSLSREALSGTVEVRASLHKSAAFIANRYPSATCTIGGTGLVVPVNE